MTPVAFVGVDGATVRHNTIYRPRRWGLRILQENRAAGLRPLPQRPVHRQPDRLPLRRDGGAGQRRPRHGPRDVHAGPQRLVLPGRPGAEPPEAADPRGRRGVRRRSPVPGRRGGRPATPAGWPRGPGRGPGGCHRRPRREGHEAHCPRGWPCSSTSAAAAQAAPPSPPERPRLVVLTDISSLTAGVAEPDDGQSLIRLMLYANEFDIEGLVASSNLGHGQRVRPELIRQVVDAYEKVRPNLLLHDPRYPPAEGLRDGIKAGQPVAGPKVPVAESVGEGKDTEASEWIIRVVDRPDPRPVWVVDLGRLGRPGPGALEGPRDTQPGGARPLRGEAAGPRHRRPGLDRAVDQGAVPRPVHDHPAAGLPGDVPGRRHLAGPRPSGSRRTSTATGRWATSTRTTTAATSGRATLGRVRGIKEGDTPSFLVAGPQRPGRRGASPAGELGRAVRGRRRSTDRRAGHGPGHLGRPRPPDVVGLPLAAGVPGRLPGPAGLVHQALRRGQPPARRADRRGPGAEGRAGRGGRPRRRRHDRPGRRRAGLRLERLPGDPGRVPQGRHRGPGHEEPTGRHRPGAGGPVDPDPALRHRPGRTEADPLRACPPQGRKRPSRIRPEVRAGAPFVIGRGHETKGTGRERHRGLGDRAGLLGDVRLLRAGRRGRVGGDPAPRPRPRRGLHRHRRLLRRRRPQRVAHRACAGGPPPRVRPGDQDGVGQAGRAGWHDAPSASMGAPSASARPARRASPGCGPT